MRAKNLTLVCCRLWRIYQRDNINLNLENVLAFPCYTYAVDGNILTTKMSIFNNMRVIEGSEMLWKEIKVKLRNIFWYAVNGDGLGDRWLVVRKNE